MGHESEGQLGRRLFTERYLLEDQFNPKIKAARIFQDLNERYGWNEPSTTRLQGIIRFGDEVKEYWQIEGVMSSRFHRFLTHKSKAFEELIKAHAGLFTPDFENTGLNKSDTALIIALFWSQKAKRFLNEARRMRTFLSRTMDKSVNVDFSYQILETEKKAREINGEVLDLMKEHNIDLTPRTIYQLTQKIIMRDLGLSNR